MSWEGFMHMERRQLRERCEGKLRRAVGVPLPGETAKQGLVAIKHLGGRIYFKHIDDLSPLEMRLVTAAGWVEVGWLKERVERRKRVAEAPSIPTHLR